MASKWLNVEEASQYLGVSLTNLYSMAQGGRIPAHKIGKMWRFDTEELDVWIKESKPLNEFFMSCDFNIADNPLLRDPQREAYKATRGYFSTGKKRAIVQLPVGCGKSGLIAILPLGIARGRVLVVAPNLTIKEELAKSLDISNRRNCFWHKCKILSKATMLSGPFLAKLDSVDSNIHDCDESQIVLTNIQQLASSADKWLPQFTDDYFDLILVDEGHHSVAPSWEKVFQKFPNAKVVNLTATPFRSDELQIGGDLVYRYSFKRAMLKGYIKKMQATYVAPEELYFTYQGDSRRHTLKEVLELKEEEWFSKGVALSPVCNKSIVDASLDKMEQLRRSGTKHQLIAVACNVNHAKDIRSLYRERGYEAEEIYSTMPLDKKAEVLQRLESGRLDCIIQVQMLGEGFDHPHLSVAAIFRPFRSLAPYVQFVGRIMRVIVQYEPRHPDNYGHVVTHIGMNLDTLLEGFRDFDREDREFFADLISGKELEPPREVIEGRTRQRVTPSMVVHEEVVESFYQESFIDTEDEALLEEMRSVAESLGLDGQDVLETLKKKQAERFKSVESPEPFVVQPQRQRTEARRRLHEQVKSCANILLNRAGLSRNGRELAFQYFKGMGVSGENFVAAVMLINHEVNKVVGIQQGGRDKWRTEDYKKATDSLDEIIKTLTRRIKKEQSENG